MCGEITQHLSPARSGTAARVFRPRRKLTRHKLLSGQPHGHHAQIIHGGGPGCGICHGHVELGGVYCYTPQTIGGCREKNKKQKQKTNDDLESTAKSVCLFVCFYRKSRFWRWEAAFIYCNPNPQKKHGTIIYSNFSCRPKREESLNTLGGKPDTWYTLHRERHARSAPGKKWGNCFLLPEKRPLRAKARGQSRNALLVKHVRPTENKQMHLCLRTILEQVHLLIV